MDDLLDDDVGGLLDDVEDEPAAPSKRKAALLVCPGPLLRACCACFLAHNLAPGHFIDAKCVMRTWEGRI